MSTIKKVHVYDMDGTIVDSSHRYQTMPCGSKIDLPYWIANEHKTGQDTLLPLAKQYREDCANPEIFTIIATARIWCNLTEIFVAQVLGAPNWHVARRDRDDNRGGAALKITAIKKLLNLKQFKAVSEIHVFEDNISYCKDVSEALGGIGHYYPSNQGH